MDHVRQSVAVVSAVTRQRSDHPVTTAGGVSDLDPGQRAQMVVDLAAGTCTLICLDEAVHDHMPHFMHGMVRQFAVGRPAKR
jgi:hypothetical protein